MLFTSTVDPLVMFGPQMLLKRKPTTVRLPVAGSVKQKQPDKHAGELVVHSSAPQMGASVLDVVPGFA